MSRTKKVNDGPVVLVDGQLPHDPETLFALSRKFWVDGETTVAINAGVMTPEAHAELTAKIEAAIKANKKTPVMPNLYQPALAQLCKEMGARISRSANKEKASEMPAGWDANALGEWRPGMALGKVRLMHIEDIRKEVAEGALVKVGFYEFVVGRRDGDSWVAAPYNIDGSKTGQYLTGVQVAKEISYEEMTTVTGEKVLRTEFNTVVGRINNAPEMFKDENGAYVVCPPNTHVTWGHIMKDGSPLTAAQIHDLTEIKGTSFRPLKSKWIGCGVSRTEWWKEVRRRMGLASTKRKEDGETQLERFENRVRRSADESKQGETSEKAWFNISNTQCRFEPNSPTCFGYRFVMVGQAIGTRYTDELTKTLFVCLGGALPVEFHETLHDAKRRLKPAPVVVETPAPAPEAPKAEKSAKKSGKKSKKSSKKSKVEPTVESVVPPVEDAPVIESSETVEADEPTEAEVVQAESDAMTDAMFGD